MGSVLAWVALAGAFGENEVDVMPACHAHAASMLRKHGIPFKSIVSVDVDAILYLNRADYPMTGWLRKRDGQEKVLTERGFPAFPDAWVDKPKES